MKVRWGVIGCGGIAYRRTIPGLVKADNSELVAVMDTDLKAAERVAKEFNAEFFCGDINELLNCDKIDAVYIASPVFCHKEQVKAAAEKGKHILLEKPMGLTVKEALEIEEICNANGIKLGVGFMMRFNNLHETLKKSINEGDLGTIVSMRAQFTCWYPEIEGAWRQKFALSGGGALMDMGIHCVDLIRYVSGLEAQEITSFVGNQIFKYEVEDAGSIIMRMNNGALAYVDAAFNIPDDAAVCKFEIYGTKGSAVLSGSLAQDEAGECRLVLCSDDSGYDANQMRKEGTNSTSYAEGNNLYTKEIHAFADAVLFDKIPPVSSSDAIASQRVIEAAYESANSGKAVRI